MEVYAIGGAPEFPVHHAWNLDRDGKLFDRTWKNSGIAYLGVVFSIGRIVDTYGRSVLDDPESEFAIVREPWTGEK